MKKVIFIYYLKENIYIIPTHASENGIMTMINPFHLVPKLELSNRNLIAKTIKTAFDRCQFSGEVSDCDIFSEFLKFSKARSYRRLLSEASLILLSMENNFVYVGLQEPDFENKIFVSSSEKEPLKFSIDTGEYLKLIDHMLDLLKL